MKKILVVSLFISLLTACDQTENEKPKHVKANEIKKESHSSTANEIKENTPVSDSVSLEKVTVTISKNKGETVVSQQELSFNPVDDMTVMDLMRKHFEITMQYDEKVIASISNISSSRIDETAWILSINGEAATSDPTDIKIKNGDQIQFDLYSTK